MECEICPASVKFDRAWPVEPQLSVEPLLSSKAAQVSQPVHFISQIDL